MMTYYGALCALTHRWLRQVLAWTVYASLCHVMVSWHGGGDHVRQHAPCVILLRSLYAPFRDVHRWGSLWKGMALMNFVEPNLAVALVMESLDEAFSFAIEGELVFAMRCL